MAAWKAYDLYTLLWQYGTEGRSFIICPKLDIVAKELQGRREEEVSWVGPYPTQELEMHPARSMAKLGGCSQHCFNQHSHNSFAIPDGVDTIVWSAFLMALVPGVSWVMEGGALSFCGIFGSERELILWASLSLLLLIPWTSLSFTVSSSLTCWASAVSVLCSIQMHAFTLYPQHVHIIFMMGSAIANLSSTSVVMTDLLVGRWSTRGPSSMATLLKMVPP